MTTSRERYTALHGTRVFVFLFGIVGLVICYYTQSFNDLLFFGAVERLMWHWLPQITRLELLLIDRYKKWRNK